MTPLSPRLWHFYICSYMGTLSISLTVGVVYTFWGLIFVFLVLALLFMGLTPLNPHQRQVQESLPKSFLVISYQCARLLFIMLQQNCALQVFSLLPPTLIRLNPKLYRLVFSP